MNKAEKCLLLFLDDVVKSKHQRTTPADKAKAEKHKYVDEGATFALVEDEQCKVPLFGLCCQKALGHSSTS